MREKGPSCSPRRRGKKNQELTPNMKGKGERKKTSTAEHPTKKKKKEGGNRELVKACSAA